jgi:hypothetical protein
MTKERIVSDGRRADVCTRAWIYALAVRGRNVQWHGRMVWTVSGIGHRQRRALVGEEREARKEGSGRWAMADGPSGTSGIENKMNRAKNKASEVGLQKEWR